MSEALGLSIGVDNLVATRAGGVPVSRRSVLTLFDQRPSEVGLSDKDPSQSGLVIGGFVERVGDQAPLLAGDGRRHNGAALMVEALAAIARTAGYGTPIAVAVPAYWSEQQTAALRNELLVKRGLISNGVPPQLISDAKAAAAALSARPAFPAHGVVAVCDFGAGGTTLTLLAAGSNVRQIGQSVRDTGLSGNEIDHLLADHLQRKARNARTVALKDAVRTGPPELSPRDSKRVKEQLSTVNSTTVAMGPGADIFLSRKDLEQLIAKRLEKFTASVDASLQRNGIPRAGLTAVAIIGGGAGIPSLAARLSERLRVPALTTPQPGFVAATGAAILAAQQAPPRIAPDPDVKAPTKILSPPPTLASTPPTVASPPPTLASTPSSAPPTNAVSPGALGAGTPSAGPPLTQIAPTASLGPPAADPGGPAEHGALAWSEESGTGEEPVPYAGPEHGYEHGEHLEPHREESAEEHREARRRSTKPARLPWYKRTALILTLAGACAAALAALGLTISLGHSKTGQHQTTTTTPTTTQSTTEVTTTETTTTPVATPTTESTEPETTDYPAPPVSTAPPRSNPPPATSPYPKAPKSQPTPTSPTPSTNKHGPQLPPIFPTPKH